MPLSMSADRITGQSPNQVDVSWAPSDNHNGDITPRFLIYHYTASSFASARDQFLRNSGPNRTSAHLMVDRDGSITQFVALRRRAWHAGVSRWGGLSDLNSFSIGIEVVNYGYLLKSADGRFRAWSGQEVPADQVVEARHQHANVPYTFWHAYTPAQVDSCLELGALLVGGYGLEDVLGHDDIAPERKLDPGPAFPLVGIRSRATGRDSEVVTTETIFVTAARLNIRTDAGVGFSLAGEPLPRGTALLVLARNKGWVKVKTITPAAVEGWVNEAFTSTAPPGDPA